MTTPLWLYVAARLLICVTAGEIALRYTAWAWALRKAKLAATPVVMGVAGMAFWRFCIEARWASYLSDPNVASTFTAIDGADAFSQTARFATVLCFCFFAIPVTKIQYGNSLERAVIEALVRVFLIAFSIGAGWVMATLYYFR